MTKFLYTALFLAAIFMTASCAQEKDESSESVQNRILAAYIEKYYPDAERTASGLYIAQTVAGAGRTPQDTSYVLVDYVIKYLDGSYHSYTSDSIAKQTGDYTPAGYYHPRIWSMEDVTNGVAELLLDMKEGGYVKAIIPPKLLDQESGAEIAEGDGSSKIYEIYLREVIDNPYTYQIDMLEEYSKNFGVMDTTDTEYGMYFRKTRATLDSIDSGASVNVRYVGKYLDGTVFDTNIADTAKKYGIYSSDNTYSALTFKYQTDEADAIEENSFVQGFTKALWRMRYREQAFTFFYSSLGYGDEGSGDIPGYVPLYFRLWIEEEEE